MLPAPALLPFTAVSCLLLSFHRPILYENKHVASFYTLNLSARPLLEHSQQLLCARGVLDANADGRGLVLLDDRKRDGLSALNRGLDVCVDADVLKKKERQSGAEWLRQYDAGDERARDEKGRTSNSTPLPSTLAKILPFPSPLYLTLTKPVPIFSHFPPTNRLNAPLASQAVSSPSSPTPDSISVGSDAIVGAGASSVSSSVFFSSAGADAAASVAGAADAPPKEKEEETARLGEEAAAPKEKLGAPPGRRWKDGLVVSAGGGAGAAGVVEEEPKGVKEKGAGDVEVAAGAAGEVERNENGLDVGAAAVEAVEAEGRVEVIKAPAAVWPDFLGVGTAVSAFS